MHTGNRLVTIVFFTGVKETETPTPLLVGGGEVDYSRNPKVNKLIRLIDYYKKVR